jgi:hypothetical protein
MFRCTRTIGVTMLAVASIVGGLVIFGHPRHDNVAAVEAGVDKTDHAVIARHVARRVADHFERHRVVVPHVDVPDPDSLIPEIDVRIEPRARLGRSFPFEDGFPIAEVHEERFDKAPHWMLIALGTVLVIGGWLLVNRDRTRPVALKAVTLLGLAATGFVLFTFFKHAPDRQIAHSTDRVIKVSTGEEPAPPARLEEPQEAKRPARAKRPIARAEKLASRPAPTDELPPRAGEIPVAAELAQKDSATLTAPLEPAAAAPPDSAPRPPADQPVAP